MDTHVTGINPQLVTDNLERCCQLLDTTPGVRAAVIALRMIEGAEGGTIRVVHTGPDADLEHELTPDNLQALQDVLQAASMAATMIAKSYLRQISQALQAGQLLLQEQKRDLSASESVAKKTIAKLKAEIDSLARQRNEAFEQHAEYTRNYAGGGKYAPGDPPSAEDTDPASRHNQQPGGHQDLPGAAAVLPDSEPRMGSGDL